MAKKGITKSKWLNTAKSLSALTVPAFIWFVLGGSASIFSDNKPPIMYLGVFLIACVLVVIQWSINARKNWAIWMFYLLVPINILASYFGWISLLYMIFNWPCMHKILKFRISENDIKNETDTFKVVQTT